MSDDETDDGFEAELADALRSEFDADPELAAAAADRVAAFCEDWDEDLTTDRFLSTLRAATAYNGFTHRFDLAVGELADANEDCTDSRAYRLSGFGDLAADPEQGNG